jgi:subtilisin family serine protease
MPDPDCFNEESHYALIVEYTGGIEDIRRRYDADCIILINYRFAIVYISREKVDSFPGTSYPYSTHPRCFGLMDDQVLEETGRCSQTRRAGLDLTGNGVLVAVVDTGVDYTNPVFHSGRKLQDHFNLGSDPRGRKPARVWNGIYKRPN